MFGLSQREKDNALFYALDRGDADRVRRLLEKGADPNYSVNQYGTMLTFALRHYDESAALACVKLLLDKGASVYSVDDSYNRTALHWACYRSTNHLEVIQALIDAGSDVNVVDSYGQTPLMTALLKKGWDTASLLLDYVGGEDKSSSGQVLITAVANLAPPSLLSRMVEKLNIDINAASPGEGTTVLLAAVTTGQQRTVDWVLARKGVNPNAANLKGETPLQLAVAANNKDMVKALLAAGANPDVADKAGNTPLVLAARHNNQDIAEMLVKAKAPLDKADSNGMTPLAVAAGSNSIRMVMTLLAAAEETGAKLALQPALFAAAEKGHGRVLELLIAAGADVNACDAETRTPLMRAVNADQIESLSILIKAGAKPDVGDQHGMFAYDHAVAAGKNRAKDYLSRYRHEHKGADAAPVVAPAADYHYLRLNDHSLEVREGDSLSMTFNFWTQQMIIRNTEHPAPVTVQNFADIQRQEAIDEAYAKLKELGGNPPDPHASVQKKLPGLNNSTRYQ